MSSYVVKLQPVLEQMKEARRDAYINELVESLNEEKWDQLIAEEMRSGLKTKEQCLIDVRNKLLKPTETLEDEDFVLGFATALDHAKEVLTLAEVEQIENELKEIGDKINSGQLDPKVTNENPIAKAYGLSNESLFLIQKIAFDLYARTFYKEARSIYALLTQLEPRFSDYWFSLGQAEKELGNNDAALQAFLNASLTTNDNPLPYLFAASLSTEEKKEELLKKVEEMIAPLPQNEQEPFINEIQFLRS